MGNNEMHTYIFVVSERKTKWGGNNIRSNNGLEFSGFFKSLSRFINCISAKKTTARHIWE